MSLWCPDLKNRGLTVVTGTHPAIESSITGVGKCRRGLVPVTFEQHHPADRAPAPGAVDQPAHRVEAVGATVVTVCGFVIGGLGGQ